jgi:hypothetical protein
MPNYPLARKSVSLSVQVSMNPHVDASLSPTVVAAFAPRSVFGKLLLLAGFFVCFVALLAPHLGLGSGTDFVLYRLWQLSRLELLQDGVWIIAASYYETLPIAWRLIKTSPRLIAAGVKEIAVSGERTPSAFAFAFAPQLVLAAIVSVFAFWLSRRNLLNYMDGEYMLTIVKNQAAFATNSFAISANPLQGLGETWYFTNTRWTPEFLFARFIADPGWQKVLVQTVAMLEIFGGTSLLASWLGFSRGKALAAGWIAAIMICPLTFPPFVFFVMADNPQHATLIVLALAIIPLWAGIGRGPLWMDTARTLAIGVLLWFQFIALNLFVILTYPFVAIASAVFLISSWPNRREFWHKVMWACLLLLVLYISGLPQALYGTIQDTASQFFTHELMRRNEDRTFATGSILFQTDQPIGVIVTVLGLVGAASHVVFGRGRARLFAIAVALSFAVLFVTTVLFVSIGWAGAVPLYYEYVLWPAYMIFAVSFVAAIWEQVRSNWPNYLVLRPRLIERSQWVILPLLAILVFHGANYLRYGAIDRMNAYPHAFPPTKTVLIDYLADRVGLATGSPFRGRVVTMTGQFLPYGAWWPDFFNLIEHKLMRLTGNDHHTIGSWYFGIPTVMEFTHTLGPMLYWVAERYLARPGDTQMRTLLTLREPNVPVLRFLGVRYIITDDPNPTPGTRRVRGVELPDNGGTLAIDEVPQPNVGVSPTNIEAMSSGEATLEWIGNTGTDFTRTAVLSGDNPGSLMAANGIRIAVDEEGIEVHATSAGRSLVVIPFQFSHCLSADPHNATEMPDIRRADLFLTGLVFDRELDATLKYRLGPFQNRQCRMADLYDDKALIASP